MRGRYCSAFLAMPIPMAIPCATRHSSRWPIRCFRPLRERGWCLTRFCLFGRVRMGAKCSDSLRRIGALRGRTYEIETLRFGVRSKVSLFKKNTGVFCKLKPSSRISTTLRGTHSVCFNAALAHHQRGVYTRVRRFFHSSISDGAEVPQPQ